MKLIPAPDDPYETMMTNRLVSENGLVEMGVYRVLYGYRVKAGFVGDAGSVLDWCGGGNWKDVERLYSLCKAILERKSESLRKLISIRITKIYHWSAPDATLIHHGTHDLNI